MSKLIKDIPKSWNGCLVNRCWFFLNRNKFMKISYRYTGIFYGIYQYEAWIERPNIPFLWSQRVVITIDEKKYDVQLYKCTYDVTYNIKSLSQLIDFDLKKEDFQKY